MTREKVAFVTGASGFVGSHLVKRLLKEKIAVHILYRKDSPNKRLKPVLKKLQSHNGDIRNQEEIKKLLDKINPDYIFHLANIGLYGGIEGKDEDVINVNLMGTINLLRASLTIPYKIFVNTGSSSEYGNSTKNMSEEDPCNPTNTYAITKLAATLYAKNFARENNKPVVTLRLFSPYGPLDEPTRLISSSISKALNNQEIIISHPKNVRDFVFIDDVIDAYIACLRNTKQISGEIINIGSGREHSVETVVTEIIKYTNTKSQYSIGGKVKRFESQKWQADIKKAKRLLSWKPKTSLNRGIKRTIEGYIDN